MYLGVILQKPATKARRSTTFRSRWHYLNSTRGNDVELQAG